jgi:hypothetical protein
MMPKNTVTAASLSVLCSMLIVAFLVRLYLAERVRVDDLEGIVSQLLDALDSLQDAHLALKEAEAAERDYLASHDPADHDRYLRTVQTWKDEIGLLDLISEHRAFAPQARKFEKAGAEALNRLEVAMSSGGKILAARAGTDSLDKLAAETRTAEERELRRYAGRFEIASGHFRRRSFFCAALLCCLVVFEGLCIRGMRRAAASGRKLETLSI